MKTHQTDLKAQNKQLKQAGRLLFGDSAELRIVDPATLVLLKQNARFFKKSVFRQLVDNIRRDRRLSSVPLCRALEDGRLEVLSGNHRVKAAVEAKVELILVIVILEDLTKDRRIAIQLSHNAIEGEDDIQVLADLWAQIEKIEEKLYAGLSSNDLSELENINFVTLSTPNIATRSVAFVFTADEEARLDEIIEELKTVAANKWIMAPLDNFDRLIERLQAVKKKKDIKNGSLAMAAMLDIVDEYLKKAEPLQEV